MAHLREYKPNSLSTHVNHTPTQLSEHVHIVLVTQTMKNVAITKDDQVIAYVAPFLNGFQKLILPIVSLAQVVMARI